MYKYLIVYELCYNRNNYIRGNSVSHVNTIINCSDHVRKVEREIFDDILKGNEELIREDCSLVILNIVLLDSPTKGVWND